MYQGLAILALSVFLYSIVAGRIERSTISGPIVFVVAGILMGPMVLGWFEGEDVRRDLRLLADLTLACFAFAQNLCGSDHIASFAGGITFGLLAGRSTHKLELAVEGVGVSHALSEEGYEYEIRA